MKKKRKPSNTAVAIREYERAETWASMVPELARDRRCLKAKGSLRQAEKALAKADAASNKLPYTAPQSRRYFETMYRKKDVATRRADAHEYVNRARSSISSWCPR